ncbi:hypothetical protein ACLI4Q_17430 [Natrialbaceae archaeon A-CW1-1]
MIAVVLLIGFVTVGALGVVAVGHSAMGHLESQSHDEAATQSLENAKAELASIQPGEARSLSFSESVEDDITVKPDDGHMTVTLNGESSTYALGTIQYERDGTHLAYQGGGVWEYADGTSRLVSAPNFDVLISESQVTNMRMEVTSLQGVDRSGSDLAIRSTGMNQSARSLPHEVPPGRMEIAIQSSYYEGWAAYFTDQDGIEMNDGDVGSVYVDHENEYVRLVVDVPYEYDIDAGVTSPASGQEIEINNNINMTAYNSAEPDKEIDDMQLQFADDVTINHNTQIEADIMIDGELTLDQNNAEVSGDVYCLDGTTDCVNIKKGSHSGSVYSDDTNLEVLSSTLEINRWQERITATENDNEQTDAIDDGELTGDTIKTPGEYYLTEIGPGDTLEVDLDDEGEVDILVDGDVYFDNEVKLDSVNGHQVNLYITDDEDRSLTIQDTVNKYNNTNDDSTNFWVFAPPGADISFEEGNTKFVGVIYAGNDADEPPAKVTFNNQIDFYGGLVASVEHVEQNTDLHYDEALIEESAGAGGDGEDDSNTTYLELTITDLVVENE